MARDYAAEYRRRNKAKLKRAREATPEAIERRRARHRERYAADEHCLVIGLGETLPDDGLVVVCRTCGTVIAGAYEWTFSDLLALQTAHRKEGKRRDRGS